MSDIQLEKIAINIILQDNSLAQFMPFMDIDFTSDDVLKCYQIIHKSVSSGEHMDFPLLARQLVGSGVSISSLLMDGVVATRMSSISYFKQIRELTIKRETQRVISEGISKGLTYQQIQGSLSEITRLENTVFMTGDELIDDVMTDMQKRQEGVVTIKTGMPILDSKVGFERGWLVTLAARSGIGKSALSMNMAVNMAKRGYKVMIFSLEMSPVEYMHRIFGQLTGISNTKWKYGDVSNTEMGVAVDQFSKFKDNLIIRYKSNFCSDDIIRDINAYGKPDVVILDYLQLLQDPEVKGKNRTQLLGEMTGKFKQIAVEKQLLFMMVSQVSRGASMQENKMPSLEHLRDSGSIEQDSETVLLLNRDSHEATTAVLRIGKNRHGSSGDIMLDYRPETCHYTESSF